MKHTGILRLVSLLLCGLLFAATALTLAGCRDTNLEEFAGGTDLEDATDPANPRHRGEGETVFDLAVTDGAKTTYYFVIHTSKATVGEALTELGMLAGDPGAYGLYVKSVCGITVDPDRDRAYWAFYENGQYAAAGVDVTPIVAGTAYALRVETY